VPKKRADEGGKRNQNENLFNFKKETVGEKKTKK
jgi:hypothetical protein